MWWKIVKPSWSQAREAVRLLGEKAKSAEITPKIIKRQNFIVAVNGYDKVIAIWKNGENGSLHEIEFFSLTRATENPEDLEAELIAAAAKQQKSKH